MRTLLGAPRERGLSQVAHRGHSAAAGHGNLGREVWVGDLMRHEGEQISQRATVCELHVAAHPGIGESVGGVKVPAASRGVPSVYSG
jgi:hypothetical protein